MRLEDSPQLPLTSRKKVLLSIGAALFLGQIAAAWAVAPPTTGAGDADALVALALWAACICWSLTIVLLVIRQADLPDIATASMLVTIAAFAAYALSGALDARGTPDEVNMTDALFLGVTSGGLTAMIVWGAAMAIARVLRLPTTAHLRKGE